MISLLYVAAGGARSGLAILYLFPLAGGAILAPLLLALFFAALVALFLLPKAAYQLLQFRPAESDHLAGRPVRRRILRRGLVVNRLARRLIGRKSWPAEHGADLQGRSRRSTRS